MKLYIIYHYWYIISDFTYYGFFIINLIKATLLRSRSMIKISHVLKLSCQNDKILSSDSIEKKKDGRLFSYK